ncbi:MAG: DUF1080 domain-containing protein [Bryobacterales bacterium]|nr:DUF1080 domain-containing protein [Bryobacterales bacterium]
MPNLHRRDFCRILGGLPLAGVARANGGTPLFDGSSLKGWSVQQGPESAYYVNGGNIVGSQSAGFPAWLRYDKVFENFDLQFEYFLKGWMDGGVYFSAPEHSFRKAWCGFKVSLFHQQDTDMRVNSPGAIFPFRAPKLVNVRNKGEWNQMRIRLDWPSLQVWSNGAVTHELNLDTVPEFRNRLRSGYIGFETLTYPMRFRNVSIQELPSKQQWEILYENPSDLADKWIFTDLDAKFPAKYEALGPILRGDDLGNLTTKDKYRDFEIQMYVRGATHHNGGLLFRSKGHRDWYEIQLHDVEEAHYPTGSLYFFKRSTYPRVDPEHWYFLQLIVKDATALVRINGEDVMYYDKLEKLDPGFIELQAHARSKWIEYKHIRIPPHLNAFHPCIQRIDMLFPSVEGRHGPHSLERG